MVLGAPMGAGLQEAGGRQGSSRSQVPPRGLQGVPAMLGAPSGAGQGQGGAALSPLCSPPWVPCPAAAVGQGGNPLGFRHLPLRCGSLAGSGACRLPSSCPAPHGSRGTDTTDRGGFGAGGCLQARSVVQH